MYLPAHFVPDDDDVRALLEGVVAGELITASDDGIDATLLPWLYDDPGSRPEAGPHGALVGHLARANRQWARTSRGPAMVLLRGPDGYVSPSWYATKQEHGRVVPTWNYVTAHVHGELIVHDDVAWLEALVRRLTDRHERQRPEPWSVDDAPVRYVEGQLRAIVGVELRIERIEAKAKLSQNRSAADVDGTIAGLEKDGAVELAAEMRRVEDRRGRR